MWKRRDLLLYSCNFLLWFFNSNDLFSFQLVVLCLLLCFECFFFGPKAIIIALIYKNVFYYVRDYMREFSECKFFKIKLFPIFSRSTIFIEVWSIRIINFTIFWSFCYMAYISSNTSSIYSIIISKLINSFS